VCLLTKKKFVFVYEIRDTKVNGAKYQDEWLSNAIQESNHKYQDGLGIYTAVVDHGGRVQFGKVYPISLGHNEVPIQMDDALTSWGPGYQQAKK
jgi:hypothetical protein